VGSNDTQDVCLETGHIGIYVSSKFQRQFAPRIANWLKERDQADQAEPVRKQQSMPDKKEQAQKGKAKSSAKVKKKRAAKPAGAVKKPLPVPQSIHQTTAKRGKSLLIQRISEAI
jgi:polyhydroxyalkanoate synthase